MGGEGRGKGTVQNRAAAARALGKGALILLGVELAAVAVIGAVLLFMQAGRNSLRRGAGSGKPALEMEAVDRTGPEDGTEWEEGWIRYNGEIYEYNEDMLTILLLGIDKMEKVSPSTDGVSGGQSDAIFLLAADTDKKTISLIGVNRDTIVDVLMPGIGKNGENLVYPSQIAVQHGFGDGMEGSCELTEKAVSRLFYDLPIHGYASFNMGGIAALNDALGGVDVEVLEDLTKKNKKWEKGAQVHLEGEDAFWYVKWRDTSVFESARGRLARQKQYLGAFADKAVSATKKDITLPVTLYRELKDYIVTDISIDEMAFLAGELSGYEFDGEAIYTLEGETVSDGKHEQFYPDMDALKDLMIRVYYRPVDR